MIDGHRRLAAANLLRMIDVPVIVAPLGLQDGWTALNSTSMPIQSKDWVYIHSQGVGLEYIKPKFSKKIEQIETLIGEDGLLKLALNQMATSALDVAKQVSRYVGKTRQTDDELVKTVLIWLIDNEQQASAKAAMRQNISPRLLMFAIENNEKLSQKMREDRD